MNDHDHDPTEPPEKGIDGGNVALVVGGIFAGVALALGFRKGAQRWRRGEAAVSPIGQQVIDAARHLATPNPPLTYVGPGDERWDDIVCGGLIGPGQWQYYEDGHGTSCAVFATAVLAQAGVDVWTSPLTAAKGSLLLNYNAPRGVGFVPGAWQKRFLDGGRKLGIYRSDADLQPGDLYCSMRDNNPAKWHVGIVVERHGADILDASGGQKGPPTATAPNGRECARLVKRTLRGSTLSGGAGPPAKIMWRLTWP